MTKNPDFLILGGGTAGCVLAGRLLELQAGSVTVVEHGGSPVGRRVRTPIAYPALFGSRWDEGLRTLPQPGLRQRKLAWPRARMLGGCSGINAMIYQRGSPSDFADWPDNWGYDHVSPAFAAVEKRLFGGDADVSLSSHSPQSLPPIHPLTERFLESASKNLPRLRPGSVETQVGCLAFRRTQVDGRRQTTFDVFLKPYRASPQLQILQASVASISIRADRAIGIEAQRSGNNFRLQANKAIILCAGTVHSPLLLMRSGIGPKDVIARMGRSLRQETPDVGANLQDHLVFPLIYRTPVGLPLPKNLTREQRLAYVLHRNGPLASNIAEAGAFLSLRSTSPREQPEIQWHFTPTHYLEYPMKTSPSPAWSLGITLLHPQSRGTIRPSPEDPFTPLLDPRYGENPDDLEQTLAGVAQARTLARSPPLAEVSEEELLPGLQCMERAKIVRSLQAYSTSIFHPVGTCAIGEGGVGVVDPRLKVRGIDNLYVADTSIIPHLPSANPQAIAMMIGYRMAEFLSTTCLGI